MSEEAVKAVVFDMMGTLVPQSDMRKAVLAHTAVMKEMFAIDLPVEEVYRVRLEALRDAIAWAASTPFYLTADMVRREVRAALDRLSVPYDDEQLQPVFERFWVEVARNVGPQEGAAGLLRWLRREGFRTGIASVNDERELAMLVDVCGFGDDLDFVLSSEAAGSCKPDSGIFLKALELAGAAPAQAVFIGDMPDLDILGANRVGMRSVLLTQEGGHLPELDPDHPEARPDYVIGHLEEFVPAVLGRDWP